MRRSARTWMTLTAASVMCGCHYNVELHRLTQERKLYDDLCSQNHNVWRMFYEGTDPAYHRFLVNDMDRWRHVRIAKEEIELAEPLPTMKADSSLGYYCVDPCKGWGRVTGSCWLGGAGGR